MLAHRRRLARTVLAASLALAAPSLSGCSDEDGNAEAPQLETSVPDIRGEDDLDDPYRGILDARFVEDLPAYTGQEVTVLATVTDVLSPRTFTVTSPEDEEVGPVLVVTTDEAADFEPEAGDELVLAATPTDDFAADTVGQELGLSLEEERHEEWEDDIYLLTTIVEPAP